MLELSAFERSLRKTYLVSCERLKLGNEVVIDREPSDFERFKYWFEQQHFYLTDMQFLFCQSQWLQMVVDVFEQKDELEF